MPDVVMVETYAPGRELTTTVMGDRALGVTDIITDGWYDYDAKYKAGGSRHVVPAVMPDEITAACLDYALRAHRALGCRGLSRTDFRWDESRGLDGLILLETNTQPGMTPTSLSPEQAAQSAQEAGARMLVLSHLVPPLPNAYFYPAFLGDGPARFGGEIVVGEDGMLFSLPARSKAIERRRLL